MNHEEIRLLLSAYVDEEVNEQERTVVEQHIAGCRDCRAQLEQMRAVKMAVHAAGDVELPFAFANEVARSIHHDDEVKISWADIEHLAVRFVLGLSFLVLLLLGVTSYQQRTDVLPMERYVSGVNPDSAMSQLLTKQGAITRDDVMFAVLTR
jgi:anti-sigma factor RsiW